MVIQNIKFSQNREINMSRKFHLIRYIVKQTAFHGHLPRKFRKHVFVLEMGQKPYVYVFNNYYNITKVNRAL